MGNTGADGGCEEPEGPQALSLRSRPASIKPALCSACPPPKANSVLSSRLLSPLLALMSGRVGEACNGSIDGKLLGPS